MEKEIKITPPPIEEWKDSDVEKYFLFRECCYISRGLSYRTYQFLAFHTAKQRELFLQENEDLVRDYYMID